MSAVSRACKYPRCVVRFSDRELWAPEQAACEVQEGAAADRAAMVSEDDQRERVCERSVAVISPLAA